MSVSDAQQSLGTRGAGRFALRFAAWSAVGLSLYDFPYAPDGAAEALFSAYLSGYARGAGYVLSLLEPGIVVIGTSIVGRTGLEIVKNCDAMETVVLFGAATLATEGRRSDRLLALSAGVSALTGVNVARICSLYFIQVHLPNAFDTIHLEVWPPLLLLCATLQFWAVAAWLRSRSAGVGRAAG